MSEDAVDRLISLISDDGDVPVPADLLRAVIKEVTRARRVAAVLTERHWVIPDGCEVRVDDRGMKIGAAFEDGAVVVEDYAPPPGFRRLVLVRLP